MICCGRFCEAPDFGEVAVRATAGEKICESIDRYLAWAYLKAAADQVYTYPMKESAKNALGKMLQKRLPVDDIIQTVLELQKENDLCIVPDDDDHAPHTARIICSMGLSSEN